MAPTTQLGTVGGAVPVIELRHRLGLALDHAGLKPGDMAAVLHVHRNTVGGYLSGRTPPSHATLALWALRCGVSFHWLVTGNPAPPSTDGDISTVTLWYPDITQHIGNLWAWQKRLAA